MLRTVIGTAIGATVGFTYYYFVGCKGG